MSLNVEKLEFSFNMIRLRYIFKCSSDLDLIDNCSTSSNELKFLLLLPVEVCIYHSTSTCIFMYSM